MFPSAETCFCIRKHVSVFEKFCRPYNLISASGSSHEDVCEGTPRPEFPNWARSYNQSQGEAMRFFVTGASGYIGGSVAQKLQDAGHEVLGLVRSEEKARLLKERGIKPIVGALDEAGTLT